MARHGASVLSSSYQAPDERNPGVVGGTKGPELGWHPQSRTVRRCRPCLTRDARGQFLLSVVIGLGSGATTHSRQVHMPPSARNNREEDTQRASMLSLSVPLFSKLLLHAHALRERFFQGPR